MRTRAWSGHEPRPRRQPRERAGQQQGDAQVNNMFDVHNLYNVNAAGAPVTTDVLPIWNAPRTYLAGITIDTDWTH